MKINDLKGTGVAVITPFQDDNAVDYEALKKQINHLIEGKVEYIVSLGTTGESATLTKEEKTEVLDFTVEQVNGRIPIVAGFGGNNTRAVIDDIEAYHFTGVSAILSVSPYYNKPTQRGIFEHYQAIAGAAPVPIILYNVPGRTSSNITAETTLKLAHEVENIKAIKEASGDLEQCMAIVQDKPDDFLVVSGEDALTLPMIACGMDGVISVTANAFPYEFSEMVRQALNGNFKKARELHYKLFPLMKLHFADGNPGGVKASLKALGISTDKMRQPLANVNEDVSNRIGEAVKKIQNG